MLSHQVGVLKVALFGNRSQFKPFKMGKKKAKGKKRYPTDQNDRRWNILRRLLLDSLPGCPRTVWLRRVLDAFLYVTRSGCARRHLAARHKHPTPPTAWTEGLRGAYPLPSEAFSHVAMILLMLGRLD
jgi:hypothetical protein